MHTVHALNSERDQVQSYKDKGKQEFNSVKPFSNIDFQIMADIVYPSLKNCLPSDFLVVFQLAHHNVNL